MITIQLITLDLPRDKLRVINHDVSSYYIIVFCKTT